MSDNAPIRRPLAACTIVSRNYLSHAKILAESFLRHEPGGRFYLLVVDGLPSGHSAGDGVRVIDVSELDLPYFHEMAFKYTVIELSTAVKPSLLSLLLNRYEEEVAYIDPDILIMKPLSELKEVLPTASIVLTPHLLKPIPLDGYGPQEEDLLAGGSYNLGFIAVRKTEETHAFLRWWAERLFHRCTVDYSRALFTDQKWIDLVPGMFRSTVIFRDETYNVAYWNLHARVIEKRGGEFFVNGRPLAFFHFSSFNPEKPLLLSKNQNRTKVVKGTALADLLQLYANLHMKNGYLVTSKLPYGHSTFDNGSAISLPLRRMYYNLDAEKRRQFGNPFHVNGASSFFQWAPKTGYCDRLKLKVLSRLTKFVLKRLFWRNALPPSCSLSCLKCEMDNMWR